MIALGSKDSTATNTIGSATLNWLQYLSHPYPRYGFAVALTFYAQPCISGELSTQDIREALTRAIEDGLEHFRMRPLYDPANQMIQRFEPIPLHELRHDESFAGGGNKVTGRFLFPTILATDKSVGNTFKEAERITEQLRNTKTNLSKRILFKRSTAPITGKLNNGEDEKRDQSVTLFEAACAMVATLCREKAAAYVHPVNKTPDHSSKNYSPANTALFPDLDFDHLREFVRVFRQMQMEGSDLLLGKSSTKGEFSRPPIHQGNYPGGLAGSVFGSVGLLAAIGQWAQRAELTQRRLAIEVLESIKNSYFYIVSYDAFSLASISHHVIDLSKSERLRRILQEFYYQTLLYSGMVYGKPIHHSPMNESDNHYKEKRTLFFAYEHLNIVFNVFLQKFDGPSFQSFLAFRAEYPPSMNALLEVYFMRDDNQSAVVPSSVVRSVRALGRWMNATAYHAANSVIEPVKQSEIEQLSESELAERNAKVREEKARKLVQFDSYIMGAKTPSDLIYRVNETTGRLSQQDAPAEAIAFMDSVASGEISLKLAQQLVLAYMRVRAPKFDSNTATTLGDPADAGDLNPGSDPDDDQDLMV